MGAVIETGSGPVAGWVESCAAMAARSGAPLAADAVATRRR
ncbi:MAG: hypothetical protein RL735_1443, partial [Pseudomonadota bacterium]